MLQEYISVNKNCLVFIILLELVGRGIYVPLVTLILALGFLFKKCLFFSFVLVPKYLVKYTKSTAFAEIRTPYKPS